MSDVDDTRDAFSVAKRDREEAEEQFLAAAPGWPHPTKPLGPNAGKALQTLVEREDAVRAARKALLDALIAEQANQRAEQ